MDSTHNPDRFMADLRQILSQGRKRIGLLVGAGAPLGVRVNEAGQLDPEGSPLIPGVEELTRRVTKALDGPQAVAVEALIADLKRIKPASSKGIYVKRVTLSTTMGPGLVIDQGSLDA